MTGRTVACSTATAANICPWIGEQVTALKGAMATDHLFEPAGHGQSESAWEDVVVIKPAHPWWQPRHYVPLITSYFEEGRSRLLVGTRGLLGEGWDAKSVNVLIDLTAAGTATAVHQMRGRSLRLDPHLPHKVADNWDVVCVAPDQAKGFADYVRFVRKHRSYYALTAQGEIESGVSHVDSRLSPYGPPPASDFAAINGEMVRRIAEREDVYARWGIGKPYENTEMETIRVHFSRSPGLPSQRLFRRETKVTVRALWTRCLGTLAPGAAGTIAGFAIGQDAAGLVVGLGFSLAPLGWLGRSMQRTLARLTPSDALEDLGSAVAEALAATGAANANLGPASVRAVPQADGYYRCYLEGATREDSKAFADALDELVAPLAAPRYIIPRYVADRPASIVGALGCLLRQATFKRIGARVVYQAVPSSLAVRRETVEAFQRAWNRHVSAGSALFYKDPRAQVILELQRGEDPFAVTTQMRTLWR